MAHYGIMNANQFHLSELKDMTLATSKLKGHMGSVFHAGNYTAVLIVNVVAHGTSYEKQLEAHYMYVTVQLRGITTSHM